MSSHDEEATLSEADRRAVFAQLVSVQDEGTPVEESRRLIAARFRLTDAQLEGIEQEGLEKDWPPLGEAD